MRSSIFDFWNSATIWLLDDKTDELWSKVADGVPLIRIPKSTGVVGEVIKNGIMLNVPDAYQHSNFNKSVDQRTGYKTTSILCCPVHNENGKYLSEESGTRMEHCSYRHGDFY